MPVENPSWRPPQPTPPFVSTPSTAVPNYLEILGLIENGLTLKAREKIMELREAAILLQEENLALRQQLSELALGKPPRANLHFEKGVYWAETSPDHGGRQGPFCQACYDKENRLVHLHRNLAPGGGWFCAVCRNNF
jgi:hypothetical protein